MSVTYCCCRLCFCESFYAAMLSIYQNFPGFALMVYMSIALLVADSKSFCRPVGGLGWGGGVGNYCTISNHWVTLLVIIIIMIMNNNHINYNNA